MYEIGDKVLILPDKQMATVEAVLEDEARLTYWWSGGEKLEPLFAGSTDGDWVLLNLPTSGVYTALRIPHQRWIRVEMIMAAGE